jgi:hypothetical protein
MGMCFGSIFLIVSAVLLIVTMLRWFEQTRDAVDGQNWSRLVLLILVPPSVWWFPSRVSAGRPMAVPAHEPVRGFGGLPKGGLVEPATETPPVEEPETRPASGPAKRVLDLNEQPPPGTPKEFLGMPKIPPKKAPKAIDPDKLAKLKQKMKEQGMLPDE